MDAESESSEIQGNPGPYRLDPILGFGEARALLADLTMRLRDSDIDINAGDVERISTPCMQILLAAGRFAEAGGRRFTITDASDPFLAAMTDLGLRSVLSRWVA